MRGQRNERKTRRDKGMLRWTERDRAVLRWIAEQDVIGLDQLQVLLGRWSPTHPAGGNVARTTATNRVIRWQRAEAVARRHLLAGQSTGSWLTRAGLALLDLPSSVWTPTPAGLTHVLAINQVRLWLERAWPDAHWCSERQLRSERPLTRRATLLEHRPDAEVQFGVQTVAMEVELSAKTPQRLPAMLYELAGRYESIWYCCSQATEASMRRALAQLEAAVQRKFSVGSLP